MILPKDAIIVLDLDDTLYSERDFETSGIKFVYDRLTIESLTLEELLAERERWVEVILDKSNGTITKEDLLSLYRNHFPNISLYEDAKRFIEKASICTELYLISDGRSITQRSKLKALGIEQYFKKIIISEEVHSEKPGKLNFLSVMSNDNYNKYIYIGDNIKKDFITPNKLGWMTICLLDRGNNVHKQEFDLPENYLPQSRIQSFDEIILSQE